MKKPPIRSALLFPDLLRELNGALEQARRDDRDADNHFKKEAS